MSEIESPGHVWCDGILQPPRQFDVRLWQRGKLRLEYEHEADERKAGLTKVLRNGGDDHDRLADILEESGDTPSGLSFDPVGLRLFRISLVWHALEVINDHFQDWEKNLLTLVHPTGRFEIGDLHNASFKRMKDHARQTLRRAGFGCLPMIGGGCVSLEEHEDHKWPRHYQGHMHILTIGAKKSELERLLKPYYPKTDTIREPVHVEPAYDLFGAVTYCYKPGFFRRVSRIDRKPLKGLPIKPLHLREIALFMSTQTLSDRLFLQRLRRRGEVLEPWFE